MITAQAIKAKHSDVFTFMRGDLQAAASRCNTPENACPASLVFISNANQLTQACSHAPAIIVLHSKIAAVLAPASETGTCYFSVGNVAVGMAILLKYFDTKDLRFSQWGARHPTCVVHDKACIGRDVLLGPYCVIGSGASIGDGCRIGAHSVIENDVSVGADSIIHPHVFIGAGCKIGSGCEIHPHSTIGSDGFGYAADPNGRPRKIAHLGNVVIGDHVEIGSSCAVDRATLTSTHIRSGTKLDNICHIAHNCDLGENGFYTAGFMMGGSTTIGRCFATGGNSVVTAHVTLGDNITLAGRSTVTADLPEAGAYGGYPLQPLHQSMKTAVNLGKINDMRKTLNRILKHLKLD
jgi:UDP-3-O-[3-hydroxymyristoyl] glucosamine N-acyltransferase